MKFSRLFATSLLAAFVSFVCVAPADAAKRDKYNEVDVSDGGAVIGKVTFKGDVPADAIENILDHQEHRCLRRGRTRGRLGRCQGWRAARRFCFYQ